METENGNGKWKRKTESGNGKRKRERVVTAAIRTMSQYKLVRHARPG